MYSIYVNDIKLLFKVKSPKQYIKMFLKSTHMGAWRKINNGYAYDTTIGKYYLFIKEGDLKCLGVGI